jgi:hypothetical protein
MSLSTYYNWKLMSPEDEMTADERREWDAIENAPIARFEPNQQVEVIKGERKGQEGQITGFDGEFYRVTFVWADEDDGDDDADLFSADELEAS